MWDMVEVSGSGQGRTVEVRQMHFLIHSVSMKVYVTACGWTQTINEAVA